MNGLLAVDAVSGEEFLRLSPRAKTEDLVLYFGELCRDCVRQKITHLTIILDNNTTHKYKLRRYLRAELFTAEMENQITVELIYLPPYSPNFNKRRIEVRAFLHRMAELETLLVENSSRPKTWEQKVREANSWKEIEADKAKRRQTAGVHLDETDLMKIFSEGSRGNTRDLVAAKVELGSGMTYAKAAKVVAQIDRAVKRGEVETAAAWRQVLNFQSVQAAYELLKLPATVRHGMLDLIATGAAQTTKEARQLLAQSKAQSQLSRWRASGNQEGSGR